MRSPYEMHSKVSCLQLVTGSAAGVAVCFVAPTSPEIRTVSNNTRRTGMHCIHDVSNSRLSSASYVQTLYGLDRGSGLESGTTTESEIKAPALRSDRMDESGKSS